MVDGHLLAGGEGARSIPHAASDVTVGEAAREAGTCDDVAVLREEST